MKVVKEATSLRLSKVLVLQAEDMGRLIGVGKGAMVSMALAFFLVKLAPLKVAPPRKRRQLLREVDTLFQELMKEAQEKLSYQG